MKARPVLRSSGADFRTPSDDPALVAPAQLLVLRHNTPAKRRDWLDELLRAGVSSDGVKVVSALQQRDVARLEAHREAQECGNMLALQQCAF